VLLNWVRLQQEYECFFFVADWHALTTEYEQPGDLAGEARDMVIDWLAAGVNPGAACLFTQSEVPEHAELHLLLSMITPLGWLERVPSYKDQRERLHDRDLDTYGFLGYPLLQAADIIIYKANLVPVGEDQVAHVELTREICRRFNYLYGREAGFRDKVARATERLGKKHGELYHELRKRYQEAGDEDALHKAIALIEARRNISIGDRERLLGYLQGDTRSIFPEPMPHLTEAPRVPGVDGQKMSKSYGNAIALRDSAESVAEKVRTMTTDPARMRRTDPGEPEKCPVWDLHKLYSDEPARAWVTQGCRSAGIGCLQCKERLLEFMQQALEPIRERTREYLDSPEMVGDILGEGRQKARETARATLKEVRQLIGLRSPRGGRD